LTDHTCTVPRTNPILHRWWWKPCFSSNIFHTKFRLNKSQVVGNRYTTPMDRYARVPNKILKGEKQVLEQVRLDPTRFALSLFKSVQNIGKVCLKMYVNITNKRQRLCII